MSISLTKLTQLTSTAPSAIAVLELNGPLAIDYLHRLWRPNRGEKDLEINAIRYGFTQIDGQSKGESVVVCRTGEQRVEIHCHGGRMASEIIRQTLVAYGAVEHLPALGCDGSDGLNEAGLIEAEARQDLIHATTLRTTSILLDQMRGALQREFAAIESSLHSGDSVDAMSRLKRLESRAQLGSHLIAPWQVVLAGPPNSGKSSLLNLLLGYARAIVHEQAGTTRDLLSEKSSFDGWPMDLIDGAGIRVANDAIEETGISQALDRIASADCVLLLVDKTTGWTETHAEIARICGGRCVLVETKSDLATPFSNGGNRRQVDIPTSLANAFSAKIETSSVTGHGLKELIDAVVQFLVPDALQPGEPIPFRARHRNWIAEHLRLLPSNSL